MAITFLVPRESTKLPEGVICVSFKLHEGVLWSGRRDLNPGHLHVRSPHEGSRVTLLPSPRASARHSGCLPSRNGLHDRCIRRSPPHSSTWESLPTKASSRWTDRRP